MFDNLMGEQLVMETRYGNIKGTIKYGVRSPIRSGMTPLQECALDSKEKIEGERPCYWFVNGDQSIKVRLLTLLTKKIKGGLVKGLGKDIGIFKYTIRRK